MWPDRRVMQGSGTRKHLTQFFHDHLIGTVAELPVLLAQSCFTMLDVGVY